MSFYYIREFREIRIWSRSADNIMNCISDVQQNHGIKTPLIPCESAEQACVGADVIVTVSLSTEPVVEGCWLKEGAVIISVGACRPDRRELDDELMHNSVIYIDSLQAAKAEAGDIILSGSLDRIKCDICHIIKEGAGDCREGKKFIVFKSLGMAVEDVIAAHLVYTKYLNK